MRVVFVRVLAAVILFAAGWASWTAGRLEGRLAEADRQLALLRFAGPLSEYDDIEQSLAYLGRIPSVPDILLDDLRQERATALYWDRAYEALSLQRSAGGEVIEKNADILFMAANAAYRASQRPGSEGRALDTVVATYTDVLKAAPQHVDAAYNYEFAVRVRDYAATRDKQPVRTKPGPKTLAGPPLVAGQDLPAGPTLHGQPGGPPPKADMKEFKMMIPLEGEERSDEATAPGKGQRRPRRG